MKETGEDQEPHGQTTSRTGGGWQGKTKSHMTTSKEAGEDQEPHGQTTSRTGGG